MSMSNGLSSDMDDAPPPPALDPEQSDSELSDAVDLPPTAAVPSINGQHNIEPSDDDAIHDMATSELDDEEDAPGEEDADFDEDTPLHDESEGMRHDRSSSEESSRPPKRKADDVDDEEYMKQNPELYGLRRSVRGDPSACHCLLLTSPQGRARPSRRVVCHEVRSSHSLDTCSHILTG